ncbi:TetR/AcrR family transcriptional regulator [Niveispirillum fermenti]|uniref:TetR/AcrR family transcriptional regulator n=1 Tax=Niveispirillum fermenti TaxID=1233113 RepID=UPI003A88BF04
MSVKTGAERPRHRRGTLSRERILDVASQQFQAKGYDRTSMDDVAKALSVTKPTLYYHFPSKEDILLGCVLEARDRLEAALAEHDDPALPGLTRLEIFLRQYLRVIANNYGISLVLSDINVMSDKGQAEYRDCRRSISRHMRRIVEQGMADGSIVPGDVTLTTYAIFGMFNWVTRWILDKPEFSLDAVYAQFRSILLLGIRGALPPPVAHREGDTA